MKRPIILTVLSSIYGKTEEHFGLRQAYFRALYTAGSNVLCVGRPTESNLRRLLTAADGIFLAGGTDINPKHYRAEATFSQKIDDDRDRVELLLAKTAAKRGIPFLGICRGMQVANVALGGTLYQDVLREFSGALKHQYDEVAPRNHIAHNVSVLRRSLLGRIAGRSAELPVNSLHHQGIERLAKDCVASAYAPDGLVEAIELPRHPFFLGVEWHPEELDDLPSRNIFSSFIRAARTRAK